MLIESFCRIECGEKPGHEVLLDGASCAEELIQTETGAINGEVGL